MKTDKGRARDEQKVWQEELRARGWKAEIAKGFDDCWTVIADYFDLCMMNNERKKNFRDTKPRHLAEEKSPEVLDVVGDLLPDQGAY